MLDVNSPEVDAHAETTLKVLNELGAKDKKIITVFNKIDLLWDESTREDLSIQYPEAIFISAHTGAGLELLHDQMEAIIEADFAQLKLLIPNERYDLVARLHREGGVRKEEARDEGFYLVGSVPDRMLTLLEPYIVA